jgi:hypothetical protein
MTEDQLKRIKALTVDVAEAVILDADPTNWTAYRTAPKDMQKDDRYAAKWCRGIAMNSLSVLMRLMAVTVAAQRVAGSPAPPPTGVEEAFPDYGLNPDRAEAEATELLERVQKRIHGQAGR